MKVGFMRINDQACMPSYGHDDDTNLGIDLSSCEDVVVFSKSSAIVDTGIAWSPTEIKDGYKAGMLVKSRSGMAFNRRIEASNAGVIDESYTGTIKVLLYNNNDYHYSIHKGDRIAQGIIIEEPIIPIYEIFNIESTKRGDKGFGSSGK